MFENITTIDLRIMSLYAKDYARAYSIRAMTEELKINYPHTFKRVKLLLQRRILKAAKAGQAHRISFNIHDTQAVQLLGFVEGLEAAQLKNATLFLLAQEASSVDPFCCVGLFGSRVSGKATKTSDWDLFIICQKEHQKELSKLMSKFPQASTIQLQVFSAEEFRDSLYSTEETVVKHIVRNKQIIHNPFPFYNLIREREKITYAPSQTG